VLDRRERWALAALLVVVALVYLRALSGIPLDWDDDVWLRDPIRALSLPDAVRTAFSETRDNTWPPLLRLSFAGQLWIGSGSTALLHAVDLGLYLGSTAGLYALIRRLGVSATAALWAIALWALHPTKVECVAWMTGLKDLQSLALWVGAALAITAPRPRPAVATVLGTAALLTKAATFPLAFVLALVVGARDGRDAALRRVGGPMVAAVVLAGVGAALWREVDGHPPIPWSLPVLAAWVHGVFWTKLVLPSPPAAITALPTTPWPTILVGLGASAVFAAGAWRWPRSVGLAFATWVLPQLPFLGLAKMAFWASDRHLLVASLGPALIVGWTLERVRPRAAWALPAVALAWLTLLSAARVPDWHDSARLWMAEVRRPGQHFVRWYKVGIVYGQLGRFAESEDAFDRSLALWPRADTVAHRLIASLARAGWTAADQQAAKRLEPPPADAHAWGEALDALRAAGHPELAEWALRWPIPRP
jgi:hypothetical protein